MNKRITAIFIAIFTLITVNAYAAADACGPAEPPVKLADGVYFVSNDTIEAMSGDVTKPVFWRGDKNGWGYTTAEVATNAGKKGVKVTGVGPAHYRWNLVQKGAENDGWLYIERAFDDMQACTKVYLPGKKTKSGYDFKGKGPAFWDAE